MSKQPDIQSLNSLESGSRVRIVGRGGSGSRLRMVAPKPAALQLEAKPPLHREQPASFSRFTGYGSGCSRPRFVSATSALLSILRRQKPQAGKGQGSTYPHPIPSQAPLPLYQTTNQSPSTLRGIHSDSETGLPRPFFPLDVKHNNSDNTSLPLFPPASTFNSAVHDACSTVKTPSTEYSNLDEKNQCSTPEDHRKRSVNKPALTLGELPRNGLYNIPPGGERGKKEILPKLCTDDEPTKKDRKVSRRANHSLSSLSLVFIRPSKRRRGSIYSLSTPTDGLRQLNFGDGFTDLSSGCHSPGSPICFMPASPNTNPATPNLSDPPPEAEQESFSVSSHSLSLSYPDSYSMHRWDRLSHPVSASSSRGPLFDPSTISASSLWVFPPYDDHEDVTLPITSNPTEKPQEWTGEWNRDVKDVISALRVLC